MAESETNFTIRGFLRKITRTAYRAAILIFYFPTKGFIRVRVSNSNQVLTCGKVVNIATSKLRIRQPNDGKEITERYISLLESPHFQLAKSILFDQKNEGREEYEEFVTKLCNAKNNRFGLDLTVSDYINNYEQLVRVIKDEGYLWEKTPVVVYPRVWRRDFAIIDGAHRAGIIAALGEEKLKCAILISEKRGAFQQAKL